MSASDRVTDWQALSASTLLNYPRYRHTCGGIVVTWPSKSGPPRWRAYCLQCGVEWSRPNARYRWREVAR